MIEALAALLLSPFVWFLLALFVAGIAVTVWLERH